VYVSEIYTQDLKDKGLFDEDLLLQQQIQDSIAAIQELLRKARESDARTIDFLKEWAVRGIHNTPLRLDRF
jgi:hypothetical protein